MLSKWPIRVKFLVSLGLLLLCVAILAGSGLVSTQRYRNIVKGLKWRSRELPCAADLSSRVAELRIFLAELRGRRASRFPATDDKLGAFAERPEFRNRVEDVEDTLGKYSQALEEKLGSGSGIADNRKEWETVSKIKAALLEVRLAQADEGLDAR